MRTTDFCTREKGHHGPCSFNPNDWGTCRKAYTSSYAHVTRCGIRIIEERDPFKPDFCATTRLPLTPVTCKEKRAEERIKVELRHIRRVIIGKHAYLMKLIERDINPTQPRWASYGYEIPARARELGSLGLKYLALESRLEQQPLATATSGGGTSDR